MKIVRFLALLLLACALCLLAACTDKPPVTPEIPDMTIIANGATEYTIIYPTGSSQWNKRAADLSTLLSQTGVRVQIADTMHATGDKLLYVGPAGHDLSVRLQTYLVGEAEDSLWGIAADGSAVAVYADSADSWERCLAYIQTTYLTDTTFVIPQVLWDLQIVTAEQKRAEQIKKENDTMQDELTAYAQRIQALKDKIAAFAIADFGGSEITINLDVNNTWDSPEATPIASHPRLLVTEEDLPALRQTFTNEDKYPELVATFKTYVNAQGDGSLGPAVEGGPTGGDGAPGVYNYDPRVLIQIQAKALNYLLTGDAYYGYQAIYMLMNNMLTLDIGYFQDDQWRRYGHTMYTAALVYDWCYDLLDADMQLKIISGVEHLLCSGTSSMPDKAHWGGVKMEIGFPPDKEGGTIVGHSSETQFMRDYVSFALAIFDEVPTWWDMIGGRLYEDFVPPRQLIYAAGIFPEGSAEYSTMRYATDLRAMWLLEKALGEHPYNIDDVRQVMRSAIGHEVNNKYLFSTGDGTYTGGMTKHYFKNYVSCALISAYVCDDEALLSYLDEKLGSSFYFHMEDHTAISPIEILICLSGFTDYAYDEDWREELGTVQYNGGYYQQLIVRNHFDKNDSGDTVAVLMKGAGRSSGGHDHESIGNFQIYYKGILTADAGCYDSYGTDHHFYYHEATIGHNSLLIYNPNLKNTLSGYYTGGQRKISPTADGMGWFSNTTYETGVVTGVQYGYLDAQKTAPKYAYYANDMTKVYDAATVSYVGRSMLVTYTEDNTFPMIMFVFDNIAAKSESYKKTFLLQCVKEPVVDKTNKTVTINNGTGGKLVLTSLKGADTMTVYGGDNRFYLPGPDKTINPKSGTGNMWGRVDISPATGNKTDYLMNVMYVTDSSTTQILKPTLLETDAYIGAVALNQTAIFMKSTSYVNASVSFAAQGSGDMNYYVGGLAAGTWSVKVGSTTVGTYTVTEEGHVLTFTHNGSGTVTLTPAS